MSKKIIIRYVLDRSGSMASVRNDVINGFNTYINSLKDEDSGVEYELSLTTFEGHSVQNIFDRKPLNKVKALTHKDYTLGGSTPLFDAVGQVVLETEKELTDDTIGVLVVVHTDGEENSSQKFKLDTIQGLINEKTNQGWTFVYLGANQDAWSNGSNYGFSGANTVTFDNTSKDIRNVYLALAGSTGGYAKSSMHSSSLGAPMASSGDFFNAGSSGVNLKDEDDINKLVKKMTTKKGK